MSTKNLARSVIEGGRCGHNQCERDARMTSARAAKRAFLTRLENDPDIWDDDAAPERRSLTPCFADKLSPIYRFLDSKVGRPWSAVRSELFQKFDTRTTPGRHVLFDHLLRDVCENSDASAEARRYKSYAVDAEGRLVKITSSSSLGWRRKFTRTNYHPIAAWLEGRKVGRRGAKLYWFVPTGDDASRVKAIATKYNDGIQYVSKDFLGADAPATWASFRQDRALSSREEEVFRALPEAVQEKLIAMAPARS
jgi:hypothetical protein